MTVLIELMAPFISFAWNLYKSSVFNLQRINTGPTLFVQVSAANTIYAPISKEFWCGLLLCDGNVENKLKRKCSVIHQLNNANGQFDFHLLISTNWYRLIQIKCHFEHISDLFWIRMVHLIPAVAEHVNQDHRDSVSTTKTVF